MEVEKKIEELTTQLKEADTGEELKKLIPVFKEMHAYYKETKRSDLDEEIKRLSDQLKQKGKELVGRNKTLEGAAKEDKDEGEDEEGEDDTEGDDRDKKVHKKKKDKEKDKDKQEKETEKEKEKPSADHVFCKNSWRILDAYFKANPNHLVNHQLDSYNQFIQSGIPKVFRDNNPIKYFPSPLPLQQPSPGEPDPTAPQLAPPYQLLLYLGGKNAKRIYYGNPLIYDDDIHTHYMYPNKARLHNMTYGMTIHYDVECELQEYDPHKKTYVTVKDATVERVPLGRLPIMVNSERCILHGLSREIKYNLGECREDYGGYFIIEGKEKIIVPQETFSDNLLQVINKHRVEVRTLTHTTAVQLVPPTDECEGEEEDGEEYEGGGGGGGKGQGMGYTNGQLVVTLPGVTRPIPLFIVMRALGVTSDRDIIQTCLLDMKREAHYMDLFRPSVHDASQVFDQSTALRFMATFVKEKEKGKGSDGVKEVLCILKDSFLAHIGDCNNNHNNNNNNNNTIHFLEKAYYLGYMTKKLLMASLNEEPVTDPDNYVNKRVRLSGDILCDLFQQCYEKQKTTIWKNIEREDKRQPRKPSGSTPFDHLLEQVAGFFHTKELAMDRVFKKAFKEMSGKSKDLTRQSWFATLSQLRQTRPPCNSGITPPPPQQHGSQWGYVDPLDTTEGAHHLSITATVSTGTPASPLIKWIKKYLKVMDLPKATPLYLANTTKVFVNGAWIGNVEDPLYATSFLKLHRRNGTIPAFTSVSFHIQQKEIIVYTDAGRLVRPLYYLYYRPREDSDIGEDHQLRYYLYGRKDNTDTLTLSLQRFKDAEPVKGEELLAMMSNWDGMVSGFTERKINNYKYRENVVYKPEALYANTEWTHLAENHSVVEYLDASEENTSLIAIHYHQILHKHTHPSATTTNTTYTHLEIDPSVTLGMVGNSLLFPETNPFSCNQLACSLTQQAISTYHTNFQDRFDTHGQVLNYGNIPLVKSQYLEYLNHEQIPYGVNCVVAIMSYTGYNEGEGILVNEASLKRGLFRTSHYTTYEDREESYRDPEGEGRHFTTVFAKMDEMNPVRSVKMGCDYSKLDESGLIPEGTRVDDHTIVIGKISRVSSPSSSEYRQTAIEVDNSRQPKKGQVGYVDQSFLTTGETGHRVAKIRVVEQRIPRVGDTLASRAGHKGTIGSVIPEKDMPFTSQGLRPDLIINPHVFASQRPIGQLIESLLGKTCSFYGTFGDTTAFATKGPNNTTYGSLLQNVSSSKHREEPGAPVDLHDYHTDLRNIGYTSTGTELLYNGMTGEQIESQIYVGVSYYLRLQEMVQDVAQVRAKGPLNVLTRQSVGGQLLGELERDAIVSHGMSTFLKTSFLDRADKFKLAVCNKTGLISIYNLEQNILLSPYVDGPMDVRFQMDVNPMNCRLNTATRFGRSFSVVEIPYAFKLFLQELQVLGIQARILTDKNIDRVMSLSGTDNLIKLTDDLRTMHAKASSLQKYIQTYGKTTLGSVAKKQKTHTKDKKNKKGQKEREDKPKRTVIATTEDEEEGDGEEEKEKEKDDQSGGEGEGEGEGKDDDSPVLFTLNDQPIEIPDPTPVVETPLPKITYSIPAVNPIIHPAKSEAITAVLRVEEPKEENKQADGTESSSSSSSSGTTKSITLD